MIAILRKSYDLVGRGHLGRWTLLLSFALIASGLEIVGALMVFLLLALVADPSGRLELPIIGDIRGIFAGVDDTMFLLSVVVLLGVFFVLRVVVQLAFGYAKHRIAQNAGARLSTRLMFGYLRLPYAFHLRRNSSELVRNTQQTVEELAGRCFLQTIYVLSEAVVIIGMITVLVVIAPQATAMAVVIVGSAALLLLKVVHPRVKQIGAIAQDMRNRTLSTLQQALHGVRDIKILGAEREFRGTYAAFRHEQARALYLKGAIGEAPRHIIELALLGFILTLFGTSVIAGATTDALLSTLGLFAYAGMRMQPSLQKIVVGLNSLRFSAPALDDVHADIAMIEQVDLLEDDQAEALPFRQELRLESVTFSYEQTERPALSDVSLSIRPGEVIGICGPTGGGKTTLTDLITGILSPTEGRVTVDGTDLRDEPSGWFRNLGVVPQMVFLIDDTLRKNIALGVPDGEIDVRAVDEAVEMAQLDEFVGSLPHGLETTVGERGVRVSGGQRQRIAIARALYRRPEVLVFDEGTSALDNTTEASLISSLERLRGQHTILLVAHRLSTVRNCDRIVFLQGGEVAGVGTFESLRGESEGFRALAQNS